MTWESASCHSVSSCFVSVFLIFTLFSACLPACSLLKEEKISWMQIASPSSWNDWIHDFPNYWIQARLLKFSATYLLFQIQLTSTRITFIWIANTYSVVDCALWLTDKVNMFVYSFCLTAVFIKCVLHHAASFSLPTPLLLHIHCFSRSWSVTPFIPGQFGQCARYGCFITHFLPVRLSESGEKTEGPRGRKEGTGGERGEEGRECVCMRLI